MVLSSLFETEEAEAFAWNFGNLEVPSHAIAIQVVFSRRSISVHKDRLLKLRWPNTWDDSIQYHFHTTSLSNSLGSRAALWGRNKSKCPSRLLKSKLSFSQDLPHASGTSRTTDHCDIHVSQILGKCLRGKRFWNELLTDLVRRWFWVSLSQVVGHPSLKRWVLVDGNWSSRQQRLERTSRFPRSQRKLQFLPSQTDRKESCWHSLPHTLFPGDLWDTLQELNPNYAHKFPVIDVVQSRSIAAGERQ